MLSCVLPPQGFDALAYKEHSDYEAVASTNPEFNKAIVRINIFREHRQTIQYIQPHDSEKLSQVGANVLALQRLRCPSLFSHHMIDDLLAQAELLVIDEAAAIPLPLVKKLLGPYLVFMASTINGYEGTGRSLSLKLISQLRQQSAAMGAQVIAKPVVSAGAGTGAGAAAKDPWQGVHRGLGHSPPLLYLTVLPFFPHVASIWQ